MARVTPLAAPAGRNPRTVEPQPVEPAQYTYPEVCAVLHLSHMTVRKYVESGELPIVRIGRAVRFRRIDLDAFMAAHLTAGDKAPRQRRRTPRQTG